MPMTRDELRNSLSEIALAMSTSPVTDGDSLFGRSDDIVLLPLGFTYLDTSTMTGVVGAVRWWVDLEAKRCPRWSYAVDGVHQTPRRYGAMPYDEVANGLIRVSDKLTEQAGEA